VQSLWAMMSIFPRGRKDCDFQGPGIELIPGTLRGYRAWRVATPILYAAAWPMMWPGRDPGPAICLSGPIVGPHDVPRLHCGCGYWAFYGPSYDRNYIPMQTWATRMVTGVISAHGKVLLGTQGFRAKSVRIDALCAEAPGGNLDFGLVKLAAEKYGVPCFRTSAEMLEEFPRVSIAELVGTS
jgi:hypothetical protein